MAKRSLRRYAPEVGAECLNWARSDLCGGRSAMTVPTAIVGTPPQFNLGNWGLPGRVWDSTGFP